MPKEDLRSADREMFEQLAALEAGTSEHEKLRAALIERHLPLVTFMARKFADRGEPLDDLIQVGTIGLIKAIDRFEISKGFEFSTFATPTITSFTINNQKAIENPTMMANTTNFATANITGNFMGVTEKFAHTRQYSQIGLEFYVDKNLFAAHLMGAFLVELECNTVFHFLS